MRKKVSFFVYLHHHARKSNCNTLLIKDLQRQSKPFCKICQLEADLNIKKVVKLFSANLSAKFVSLRRNVAMLCDLKFTANLSAKFVSLRRTINNDNEIHIKANLSAKFVSLRRLQELLQSHKTIMQTFLQNLSA